jgi:5-methylcytosine-specific restriction endonuclease McrA
MENPAWGSPPGRPNIPPGLGDPHRGRQPVVKRCLDCQRRITTGTRCHTCNQTYRQVIGTQQWRRTSQHIRYRDNHRCTNCGATEDLQVHHQHPVRQGGNPYNTTYLITLCRSCHNKAAN